MKKTTLLWLLLVFILPSHAWAAESFKAELALAEGEDSVKLIEVQITLDSARLAIAGKDYPEITLPYSELKTARLSLSTILKAGGWRVSQNVLTIHATEGRYYVLKLDDNYHLALASFEAHAGISLANCK